MTDLKHWLNEPAEWTEQDDSLRFVAGPGTDFWRKTHNGAVRDNGHFRYRMVEGDFTFSVRVAGNYGDLYDQAGVMVRQDETAWLKCGIEYVGSVQYASAVVTRDYSDWSVAALEGSPEAVYFKVRREGDTIEISYSLDGAAYTMMRTAYLTSAAEVAVGVMAAAPKGAGFAVAFDEIGIEAG